MNNKTIYLIDAYALIYRAYYAFIRSPRINSKGQNTSAIFGFVNTIIDILTKHRPDYIAVAFDSHGPTFRHELYSEYKANRDAQPEDIRASVPLIKEFLKAMNIASIACQGYEADDIIGTLAHRYANCGATVYLVTPDKDYAQLVEGNVRLLRPHTGAGIDDWGAAEVCEHWGVERTEQIIDLLGLWGDASDNIPGCPGIGEKRAKELLATFGSISSIYEHLDELKGKLKENFINNRELVELSRKLATIALDVPIDFDIENAALKEPNNTKLQTLFAELEFKNVKSRIDALFGQQKSEIGSLFDIPSQKNATTEQSLFDELTYETSKTTRHDYIIVQTDEELKALTIKLQNADKFCFDTETTSADAMNAEIVGLSFAIKEHEAYYIPFDSNYNECQRRLEYFANIFADKNIGKIGQNMKYDIIILSHYGIKVAGYLFDTMIAHFLLYPGRKHNMDYMAESLLKYSPIAIETLIGKNSAQRSMRDVALEQIKEYAAEDADITLQLHNILLEKLNEQNDIKKLFDEIEMPLMPVLANMEIDGVQFDTQAMHDYAKILRKQIADTEAHIKELAGCEFNIASPKQVGEILFDKLEIGKSVRKTRSGQYSTSEETLQKLAPDYPIVASILEYRGFLKLLNTYVEALPALINKKTKRIHTSFNQAVVVTGRLSSSNPNLQNIPIRDENGREIRKAFVASDKEHVIIAADYSQVELRLMAHFSNDNHLIEAFKHGEDIHAATAAKIFKVPINEVTKEMRRKAKTANFGIIYGISAFGLAERLYISRRESKEIIDGYFENFTGVKQYMDNCIEEAKKNGAVKTLFGRRRELEDIRSQNAVVRGVAERNAINAPIQGTAADIIKIAMINIHKALTDNNLQTKMILQVHDELVFDTPRSEVDVVCKIVKDCMENACQINVPLIAEIGIGNNWLEAH